MADGVDLDALSQSPSSAGMPIAQVLMSVTGQTVGLGFDQIADTVEPLVSAGRNVLTQSPLSSVQFI